MFFLGEQKDEAILYTDKWDAIQLSHTPFSNDELEERNETLLEVTDPLYTLRADIDADGEGEDIEATDLTGEGVEGTTSNGDLEPTQQEEQAAEESVVKTEVVKTEQVKTEPVKAEG